MIAPLSRKLLLLASQLNRCYFHRFVLIGIIRLLCLKVCLKIQLCCQWTVCKWDHSCILASCPTRDVDHNTSSCTKELLIKLGEKHALASGNVTLSAGKEKVENRRVTVLLFMVAWWSLLTYQVSWLEAWAWSFPILKKGQTGRKTKPIKLYKFFQDRIFFLKVLNFSYIFIFLSVRT